MISNLSPKFGYLNTTQKQAFFDNNVYKALDENQLIQVLNAESGPQVVESSIEESSTGQEKNTAPGSMDLGMMPLYLKQKASEDAANKARQEQQARAELSQSRVTLLEEQLATLIAPKADNGRPSRFETFAIYIPNKDVKRKNAALLASLYVQPEYAPSDSIFETLIAPFKNE